MLDLILVRLINQYDTKKRLFLNCTDTILIHNPSVHFPAVHDSYFVSLPMTCHDESYLHLFTLKKPNLFNQNDTTSKEIVITVISALSPRKSFSKTLLSSPIAIDYVAFPFFFSVTSSFQTSFASSTSAKSSRLSPTTTPSSPRNAPASTDTTWPPRTS